MMSDQPGKLYVVATPIGNLADISQRALQVLAEVDAVAAEDTRHSKPLLQHFDIRTPMLSLHEHNEKERVAELLAQLQAGKQLALISDAGTPLLSDPGYILVNAAREQDIVVTAVPGACAITAALSIAGLPTNRFIFEGFLPAKQQARRGALEQIKSHRCTTVLFESAHRIKPLLEDIVTVCQATQQLVVLREMTKIYETCLRGLASEVLQQVDADANQRRGEFVVLLAGQAATSPLANDAELERCLRVLLEAVPVKQAAAMAAKITGCKKNAAYRLALEITAQAQQ